MLNTNEKMKACHLNIVFPLIAAGVLQVEFDIFFFQKKGWNLPSRSKNAPQLISKND